ncbi:MAG: class I SAM-dependent methyltransferase [Dokdonella sp.]
MDEVIDGINMRTMRSNAAVSAYTRSEGLTPAEQIALGKVAEASRGEPILDIGFGGGRTVQPLLAISADYLGIDYCQEMVAAGRSKYPGVRLELADARDLSQLPSDSIALAVFSCNGIGMVGHEDRLAILAQVHRVLRPDGAFVFSTHNQNCPDHTAGFRFPEFEQSRNPARILVRGMRFISQTLIRLRNRQKFRRHDIRTSAYSMINDVCHHYGTMLYYISLANQRAQLERIGFQADADAFDLSGQPATDDCTDSSITLIARKNVCTVSPPSRQSEKPS